MRKLDTIYVLYNESQWDNKLDEIKKWMKSFIRTRIEGLPQVVTRLDKKC